MPDHFDLDRFVKAQDPVIARVEAELRSGQKQTHWMWFVFPQLAGLGRSAAAKHYAIASRAEALAYMAHPRLGSRLVACTGLVNRIEGRSIPRIFGSPDDLKFHSSVTLFAIIEPAAAVFHDALACYFHGIPDRATAELLDQP